MNLGTGVCASRIVSGPRPLSPSVAFRGDGSVHDREADSM